MFPIRDSVRSRSIPFINLSFIGLNLYVFFKELQLAQLGQLEPFIKSWGLIAASFANDPLGNIPQIFSAMFLHGGWAHVLGNMWFLLIFGDNVEDNLGHVRYFFYYLLMGVGAALVQIYSNPSSKIPMMGASGAIAGILGSYFVLFPRAKVTTVFWFFIFIRFIDIPAFFFLGIWFFMQTMNGLGALSAQAVRGDVGGVAWWAHAGGFLTGFIFIFFFRKSRRNSLL